MDVIGMTNATEARLAREAEVAYATLAMACDYDCWHEGHEDVTAEMAIGNLRASVDSAQRVLRGAIARLPVDAPASCAGALRKAILTDPATVPVAARRKLALLLSDEFGDVT
jgi:5'-methylthioadenosine phosphorylase